MKINHYFLLFVILSVTNIPSLFATVIQSNIQPNEPPVSTVQGNTIIQNYPTDYLDDSLQAPPQKNEIKPNLREGQIPRNRLPQNRVTRKGVSQNRIPRNSLPNNRIPRQGVNRAKVPRQPLERNQIKSNPITPTRIPNHRLPRDRVEDDRRRPIPIKEDL